MIAKNPLLRRLHLQPLDMGLDLSWLPPKENELMVNGPGWEAVEERNTNERSRSSNSSSSNKSSSSRRSFSNLFSRIGSKFVVFRDSDSRNSLSVDDNTKTRGVG